MTYQFHTKPDPDQLACFNLSKDAPAFAYFMDAGVGKSKPAIDTAAYLYEQDKIDAMLVVSDNGVHQNWSESELLKHMPPRIKAVPIAYVAGRSLNKFYRELGEACRHFPILCVSHDTLLTKNGQTFLPSFLKQRRCLLVVDECQKYKTPSAQRTRALWKLAPLATYRRILTGTPLTQGYEDLYAQFRVLDPDIIGCRTYAEFKAQYCLVRVWDGYSTIEGYRNTDQLLERIKPYVYVAKLKLDAPEPLWHECLVPLTDEQKRAYVQLRDEYLTEVASQVATGVVSSNLTITRMLRLSQITSGHVWTDDRQLVTIPSHRPEAARRLVARAPGKVLIWCAYKEDVELLLKELAEWRPLRFDGAIPHAQAKANMAEWKRDPERKVLILTTSKGCRGYTLNEATTAIYYSYNEDYELWTQSRARNFRRGQDQQVHYYVLVAPGTLDRKMIRTVNRKDGMAVVLKNPGAFQGWLTDPDDVSGPTGIQFASRLKLSLDPAGTL